MLDSVHLHGGNGTVSMMFDAMQRRSFARSTGRIAVIKNRCIKPINHDRNEEYVKK